MNEEWKLVDYYTDRHEDSGRSLEDFVKDCICRAIKSIGYENLQHIAIKTEVEEDGIKMLDYITNQRKCGSYYIFRGELLDINEIYGKMKLIFRRVIVTICKLEVDECPDFKYWITPRDDAYKRNNGGQFMIDSSSPTATESAMNISELEKKFRL